MSLMAKHNGDEQTVRLQKAERGVLAVERGMAIVVCRCSPSVGTNQGQTRLGYGSDAIHQPIIWTGNFAAHPARPNRARIYPEA